MERIYIDEVLPLPIYCENCQVVEVSDKYCDKCWEDIIADMFAMWSDEKLATERGLY